MRLRAILIRHIPSGARSSLLVPNSKTAAKPMVKLHIQRLGWQRSQCVISIGVAR